MEDDSWGDVGGESEGEHEELEDEEATEASGLASEDQRSENGAGEDEEGGEHEGEHGDEGEYQLMKAWTCLMCGAAENTQTHCRLCGAEHGREPNQKIIQFQSPHSSFFEKHVVEPAAPPEDPEKPPVLGHKSWQFEALEAIRTGDVVKLTEALRSTDEEQINTVTHGGGWGGFRFPTWGKYFGGTPDGESLLHLAVRQDNQVYPNRYAIVKALKQRSLDFSLRSADGKTARDLDANMVDSVFPATIWDLRDVQSWLESKGRTLKQLDMWGKLFDELEMDGYRLLKLADPPAFQAWVSDMLPSLTRLGMPTNDIAKELNILLRIINQVANVQQPAKRFAKQQEKLLRAKDASRKRESPAAEEGGAGEEGGDGSADQGGLPPISSTAPEAKKSDAEAARNGEEEAQESPAAAPQPGQQDENKGEGEQDQGTKLPPI